MPSQDKALGALPAAITNLEDYCTAFERYLNTGDETTLQAVFPAALNLKSAAVYRNGYLRACIDALRGNYPVVDNLLGSEYFDLIAAKYVDSHPPQKGSLLGYGEKFSAFLHAHENQHKLAYLASFAELDAAWLQAYFAADALPLNGDDVQRWLEQGKDIPSLPVSLVPSASIHSLRFEVSDLWLELKHQDGFDGEVSVSQHSEDVLVWRNADNQVKLKVVSPPQQAFVSSLMTDQATTTIGLAASAAMKVEIGFDVSAYFSRLLENDLLSDALLGSH